MIALLETIGPAVWRASWQGAVLAVLIALLVRALGERLSPRWRYLLWSVVVIRLLFVATPVSPVSMFNLVRWSPAANRQAIALHEAPPEFKPTAQFVHLDSQPSISQSALETPPFIDTELPERIAVGPEPSHEDAASRSTAATAMPIIPSVLQTLSLLWLVGCLGFGVSLAAAAVLLRRRLSACRPVTDPDVLQLLTVACGGLGRRRIPALLVTPEAISPCLAGTWRPRIVIPESLLTGSSTDQLRHVLAHEAAHLVRGDLWTNWLLLAARTLHWFNPVAWWAIREVQAEREAACDELALAALGDVDRSAYAGTILDLAASLTPSAIAPGMIGLFSSELRLKIRIERLIARPSVKPVRGPLAAAAILMLALAGLTDAMPTATAQSDPATAAPPPAVQAGETNAAAETELVTLKGKCLDSTDRTPIAGVRVLLFAAHGRTQPSVAVAFTHSNDQGEFSFGGVAAPRPEDQYDRLTYGIVAVDEFRPIGVGFQQRFPDPDYDIRIGREQFALAGRVVDSRGQPVAGATVKHYFIDGRPLPGILSAITETDGRFEIAKLTVFRDNKGTPREVGFSISHPDYPSTYVKAQSLQTDVTFTLPAGAAFSGTVTDKVTGRPAAGAVVTAVRLDEHATALTGTDDDGRFKLVVPEGRYNILVQRSDRVCVAQTDRECLTGQSVELPPLELIAGGIIEGQVLNAATGQPVNISDRGQPIALGLFGPSSPQGKTIAPARLAIVDKRGRFRMRAAPGENFPYFVNTRGDRMAWDTTKQPAVVVKEGTTTAYDMIITPPVPPADKLKAAKELIAVLPKSAAERTAAIIAEFRKLKHTVDETELWCSLMRELVVIGRDAVPALCAELDQTHDDRTLRRLGFALRAVGDPRAVPALIRAIPRTLLPSSSDYGLIVEDPDLMTFMQQHDLDKGRRGAYFDLGRPTREIVGALHQLTGQNLDDAELFGISLSEVPGRQALQRQLYVRQARRWQEWWETHWRELTDDATAQKVHLVTVENDVPAVTAKLGPDSILCDGIIGATLSPAVQKGQHAWHFYDLDTGYRPKWPAHIPQDEAQLDPQKLAGWAAENGVDLMCITHYAPDGTATFVLRSFGLRVREIDQREFRNLDRTIAAGTLPEGRKVGDLLMHYDPESQQLVPDANATFLYETKNGNRGYIEVTDRVTKTADLTGLASGSPQTGIGFFLGVRFSTRSIKP